MGQRETDGALLRAAHAGDSRAFSVLYGRYEALIAGFLMRRSRDPQLTADLTAETFATAVLGARRFDGDDGRPAVGWLLGIARHLLWRTERRAGAERRAVRRLGAEPVALGEASYERVEALIDAQRPDNPLLLALEALPADQREAVRAYVLDEEPYAELARRLGVSEPTVRQRVSRGLSRLRTNLEGRQP